jgi:hypothetical protein
VVFIGIDLDAHHVRSTHRKAPKSDNACEFSCFHSFMGDSWCWKHVQRGIEEGECDTLLNILAPEHGLQFVISNADYETSQTSSSS